MINNPLSKLAKRRLTKLADSLEHAVQTKWFNLYHWADEGFKVRKCGTTACALGWATVFFRELTLYCSKDFSPEVRFRGYEGFYAGAVFFDISSLCSWFLFDPCKYSRGHRGRMDVVRRIRSVVKKGWPE